MPEYQTLGAAACDVYVPEDFVLVPGRNVIPLNLSLEFGADMQALIEARSGFSVKGILAKTTTYGKQMRIDADVISGKIDSDYRGVVGVIVKSHMSVPFVIAEGTRIAQLTFVPVVRVSFESSDELSDTDRGDGGFGHSGCN